MPDVMPTSHVAAVASRTDKFIKISSMFLKEERICYRMMVYYTLFGFQSIVRSRVGKLEFALDEKQTFLKET